MYRICFQEGVKKIVMVILVLAMIGGLIYGAETESPTAELSEKNEGGNDIDRPSDGIGSRFTRQGSDGRGNKGYHQSAEAIIDRGKEESGENPKPQPKANQSKQSTSRASDRTSTAYNAGVFTITAYTAGPESTGKSPGHPAYGITASGTTVKENHTIASDWDLLPPGTKLMIEGLEHIYTVEDRGSAVKGKHIDIYIPDLEDALKWGVRERKVTIIKLGGK